MSAPWWPEDLRAWWHAQVDPWSSCGRGDWLVWWLVAEEQAPAHDVASLLLLVLDLSSRHAATTAQLESAAAALPFDPWVGPRGDAYEPGGEDQAAQDALAGLARLTAGDRYGAAAFISSAVARIRVSGDAVRGAWDEVCSPRARAVGGWR